MLVTIETKELREHLAVFLAILKTIVTVLKQLLNIWQTSIVQSPEQEAEKPSGNVSLLHKK